MKSPYLTAKIAIAILIAYVLGMMLFINRSFISLTPLFLGNQMLLFIPLTILGIVQILYGWKKQRKEHLYAGLIVLACQLVFWVLVSAQFVPTA